MFDANVFLLAVAVIVLVPVYRRHRHIAREKRTLLERLDRLAEHHDLIRR